MTQAVLDMLHVICDQKCKELEASLKCTHAELEAMRETRELADIAVSCGDLLPPYTLLDHVTVFPFTEAFRELKSLLPHDQFDRFMTAFCAEVHSRPCKIVNQVWVEMTR